MDAEINRCARTFVESLLEQASGAGDVEIKEFAGGFSMDVIASTAFGIDSEKDRNNEFVKHARKAFDLPRFNPAMVVAMLFPSMGTILTKLGINVDFFGRDNQDFFGNIARQAIELRKSDADQEELNLSTVQQMPYLDQCVNENLRMYPSLVAFSPENKKDQSPYHFLAFGHGPRSCVGMRLALQELKVAIIHVLRKVKVTKSKKTEVPVTFAINLNFLKPKNPIVLKVEARNAAH